MRRRGGTMFDNYLPSCAGMPIYQSPLLIDSRQVRFPRSKKRRIRKKWSKDKRNYKDFPSDNILVAGGSAIFIHPAKYGLFVDAIKNSFGEYRGG
jgi:hypothetical protein